MKKEENNNNNTHKSLAKLFLLRGHLVRSSRYGHIACLVLLLRGLVLSLAT